MLQDPVSGSLTLHLMDVTWLTLRATQGRSRLCLFMQLISVPKDTTRWPDLRALASSYASRTPQVPGWCRPCRGATLTLDMQPEASPPNPGHSAHRALP